jgi:xylose dehydrogenase (NAD/NADP)
MIISSSRIKAAIPRRLKWGVAGCGNFVETSFLPALALIQRSKLISIFSHDLSRAQIIAGKFGAQIYTDNFQEFIKGDFDIVYVAGSNVHHHQQVIEAAKAGKHVVCEKPVAMNSEQIAEMINTCKENNVMFAVNFTHRFHPLVLKAKELVDKGLVGKIVSVSTSFNIDYAPNDNFRFKKELSGGGALRDLGSHTIDMLRLFGGEINNVKGYLDNVVYNSDVEDFASAILKFEKGGYGYFNVSYNAKKSFNRIEILGHKGVISIENFVGKKNVSGKLVINLQGEAKKAFRKRANKISYMIKSVQKSVLKNNSPLVTGEDALMTMKIMEEIEAQCL